jgi:hypothetical protein
LEKASAENATDHETLFIRLFLSKEFNGLSFRFFLLELSLHSIVLSGDDPGKTFAEREDRG